MSNLSSGSESASTNDTSSMKKSDTPSLPVPARKSKKKVSMSPRSLSTNNFYRAFEERHRGSRDLIKSRLNIYLPFVRPLRQIYPQCTALDLGCGRGEWLELLQENGFQVHGIDLDDGMLAACTEFGLPATRQDAIEYLKSLDNNSQCIVSGFHFAEHISFANLQLLVAEAFRILMPGGLLILETPNPENLAVGTTNFYLDPTHQRPIPPLLLSFLVEYQGFKRAKVLRLQEPPDLAVREFIELKHVFFDVSPDYSVVAQKNAEPAILLNFNTAFDKQYGIELGDLADRYDAKIEHRITALDQRVGHAESVAGGMVDALSRISALQDRLIETTVQVERNQCRAQEQESRALAAEARAQEQESRALAAEARAQEQEQRAVAAETRTQEQEQRAVAAETRAQEQEQRAVAAETRAQEQEQRAVAAETRAQEQQKRIDELGGNSHHWWLQACALETERNALRQSWSWRITAPVRWMGGFAISVYSTIRYGANRFLHISISVLRQPISMMMRIVLKHPGLSYQINQRLMRYPTLHQQLINVAHRAGLIAGISPYAAPSQQPTMMTTSPDLPYLTPHAHQIYADLKFAIEQRRKEND